MGRIAIMAALAYAWGAPAFESHRPDMLERPLREFHRTVNAAAADGRRMLSAFGELRSLPNFTVALRRLNAAF